VDVNVPELDIAFVEIPPFRDDKLLTPIVPVIVVFLELSVPEFAILLQLNKPPIDIELIVVGIPKPLDNKFELELS
jgi:hypothetical protein